jgi:hypothetical protein
MKIKKFIRDITGITAREEQAKAEELKRLELVKKANESLKKEKSELRKKAKEEKERKQAEEEARLTPKELATKRKEPWVDVVHLHVNTDDIRRGFYDIDWNDYWVLKLKQEGYGADGDPDEEIVARWFREISASVAAEEGINISKDDIGYINIIKRNDGRSEVS